MAEVKHSRRPKPRQWYFLRQNIQSRIGEERRVDYINLIAQMWCGVFYGVVWSGVVWCGVLWSGVVWCGVM